MAFRLVVVGCALAGCSAAIGGSDGSGGTGQAGGNGGHATAENPPANAVIPASIVRRLSHIEIDNTLTDILGEDMRPAQRLLGEDEFRPFDNDYTVQESSTAFADAMRELARDTAERAVADPQRRSKFMPCQPQGAGDAACFRQTVQTLGRRLLRRPLSSTEVDAYMGLQMYATETNTFVPTDFYTAVALAMRALIQDPEFYNRVEIGRLTTTASVYALDSFQIASRMSYLLWGSAPDPALLDAADRAGLITADGRSAEFDRMLTGTRARTQLQRFHAMWLGYRALPHPPATTAMFNLETTKLIDTVIFDAPSSYFDLFSSDRTYVTAALAQSYGLPAPAGGEGWVSYGNTGRAGLLSHGSVLAAFSKFSDTSPTQRGILVQTRLLCNEIASPPANVNVDQPPGNPDQECKTDRYLAHRDQSGCRQCHTLMDPIGLGLENYDIAGRFRDHDDGKPQCAIAGQGDVPGLGAFTGPKELAQKLLAAGEIQDCVVRQYLGFALGRPLEDLEEPLVTAFAGSMAKNGDRFVELLRAMVAHPSFALRTLPEVP